MNLAPPPADWQEAILVGARQFMTGRICFFAETDAVTPYAPITGEGGATGIFALPVSDEVRVSLYDYVTDWCGAER